MKLTEPLIINFAPNGMVPTKDQTAHVPISAREIVDDIFTCAELGATMIHVHARSADGTPSSDPDRFAQIFEPVRRAKPELVLIATTSGRRTPEFERRAAILGLKGLCKPDMASLTLSSMNFSGSASVNAPDTIIALTEKMKERGIKPELEVFDVGMVNFAKHLIRKGLLDPPNASTSCSATSQLRKRRCFTWRRSSMTFRTDRFGRSQASAMRSCRSTRSDACMPTASESGSKTTSGSISSERGWRPTASWWGESSS